MKDGMYITVFMKELRVGEIGTGNGNLYIAMANMSKIQHHLLSEGYTMYLEWYGNYFVNTLDSHQGIPSWTAEELTGLTREANEKGLSIHIHAFGNNAV